MAHVAEWKKDEVNELKGLIAESEVVGIVNLLNIPARQLQEMRRSLKGKATLRLAKINLMNLALEDCNAEKADIVGLSDFMEGQPALICTDMNPFKLYKILEDSKTAAPAKAGSVASDDIVVPAGDTGFPPGPFLGELQQIGVKTKILGITLNESYSLEEKEEFLDRQFYSKSLQKAVDKYNFSFISRELLILANHLDKKSELDSISEPLRLEYLLALYFGKKYGLKGLISNIIYDEDGIPLHCAPGGKGDIIFHNSNASYILEPTMITSKSQQLNSETANIVRHMKSEEQKYEVPYRVMMIAPVVHSDVIEFFRFKAITDNANIASITIDKTIGLFDESDTIKDLGLNFDEIVSLLKRLSPDDFSEKINTYRYKPLA